MAESRAVHPPPAQYSAQAPGKFVDFINSIYEDAAVALTVTHVDFCPPTSSDQGASCAIEELMDNVNFGTQDEPVTQPKIVYNRDLSEQAKSELQGVFEIAFFHALNQAETEQLDEIPPLELLKLHVLAVTPCKNVQLLTVSEEWYEHVDRQVREELEAALPLVHFNIRKKAPNRDNAFLIGELEAEGNGDDDNGLAAGPSSPLQDAHVGAPSIPDPIAPRPIVQGPLAPEPLAPGPLAQSPVAHINVGSRPEAPRQLTDPDVRDDQVAAPTIEAPEMINHEPTHPRPLGLAPTPHSAAPQAPIAPVADPRPEGSGFHRPQPLQPVLQNDPGLYNPFTHPNVLAPMHPGRRYAAQPRASDFSRPGPNEPALQPSQSPAGRLATSHSWRPGQLPSASGPFPSAPAAHSAAYGHGFPLFRPPPLEPEIRRTMAEDAANTLEAPQPIQPGSSTHLPVVPGPPILPPPVPHGEGLDRSGTALVRPHSLIKSKPHTMPRCHGCLAAGTYCDRRRPCGTCWAAGRGYYECIPEPASNYLGGEYGAGPGPGPQDHGGGSGSGRGAGATA